jgi:cell wall-associated NlpC family hydrolase
MSSASPANSQERPRIVRTNESQPTNQGDSTNKVIRPVMSLPASNTQTNTTQRPVLTNQIVVVGNQPQNSPSLIQKTNSSQPINASTTTISANNSFYSSALVSKMMLSIQAKYGIPYRLGTTGPYRYDCSGFVWAVFNEAGIYFERSSARSYWMQFEPVYGDDRYKFGTLVFFNRLGHVGIVADENGFYHASRSKGITYSPFKGYWEKRIVGFRRVPVE